MPLSEGINSSLKRGFMDQRTSNLKEHQHPAWTATLKRCVVEAFPPALRTGVWLLSITIPVSFVVLILKTTGALNLMARVFEPLFALLGLPGESAVVFATACLLNIYSCIAVIETLGMTGRTVTILALMCLISHNLPVESTVQKKTGSSLLKMIAIRLAASFAGGMALNLLLPADPLSIAPSMADMALADTTFLTDLQVWGIGMASLCLKIMVLVTLLMILQRILEAFGITGRLSRLLKYPLMALGVPRQAAFLWVVANTLGLAYGAGVILDHVGRGHLTPTQADLLNIHIAISHSLLEDTLLFVAIGVSAWWIVIPRVILAGIAVWLKRLIDSIHRKSIRSSAADKT